MISLKKLLTPVMYCVSSILLLLLCQLIYLYLKSYSLLAFPKEHCLIQALNKSDNNVYFICPRMTNFRFYLISKRVLNNNIKGCFEISTMDGKQVYKESIDIDSNKFDKYKDRYMGYKYPIGYFATNLAKFIEPYDTQFLIVLKAGKKYNIRVTIDDTGGEVLKEVGLTIIGSTYKMLLNDYEKHGEGVAALSNEGSGTFRASD